VTTRDLLRGLPVFGRPLPAFDPESAPGEPSALFLSWLHAAIDAGVSEPHAMTLSTVDAEGRPDARVLILKDVDADGWQFATATVSAKGSQLVGRQSAVIEDPRKLALEIEAATQRLADNPGAIAEDHAVYVLTPAEVEFWQGDHQRQHVRLRYRRSAGGWIAERLWP
jgi:pyridoxamine 5'-phosphate oxidase